MVDDRVYFAAVLTQVVQEVRRTTGEDVTAFAEHVLARMDHGAELYGQHAYMAADRDNLAEATDEYADGISYPLFEQAVLAADPCEQQGEVHQLLFEAMVFSALAHLKVRRARRLRDHPHQ